MAKVCGSSDFFALSNFRDLLFHVQEHQFTIPKIVDALDVLNLKFLGFDLDGIQLQGQNAMALFKDTYPKKCDLTSLALWHEFEQLQPDTFSKTYELWCIKQ